MNPIAPDNIVAYEKVGISLLQQVSDCKDSIATLILIPANEGNTVRLEAIVFGKHNRVIFSVLNVLALDGKTNVLHRHDNWVLVLIVTANVTIGHCLRIKYNSA